ncbi:nucleotidyltransferase-like protein [Kribbella orskensis]|uniref:Nucleotidyltransferase-like protein n=1 Tax=Kribbella orskensis TaxID=2512216 RepID=A0ABY2BUR0_9ACTN|nr:MULTISPECIES: nucleotidyltransferase domain-containing protein [Kribbella]TCN42665.1 nucleotidyltransferase-like protein [Kribbella sp. VKM Ac-2500]TCO29979.1 nucleotidyltransferase-like protein [Kribbella orskensis]
MTSLPPEVAETTTRYLELIDKVLPDQVVGLYLTGSVPLGDFHPASSDIDGVVVVAEPMTEVAAVRSVHEELPAKPAFDVTYLTAEDLAVAPDPSKPVVFTLDGVFKEAPYGGPVSPVLWSELARQSLAVRSAPGLTIHDDHQALVDFTRANLTSYWTPSFDQLEAAVADKPGDEVLPDWILPWVVLGVPRLHALLATGNIISKTAAGEHALTTFPTWTGLITRSLTHRSGHPQHFTIADAKSAVPYGREVVTTALAL